MTFEKKRKMAEQPSEYSAVDKALYFLSNHGGKIQEMTEVVEAEREKLIRTLESIHENKYEPDKLLILAERLGAVLAEAKEQG